MKLNLVGRLAFRAVAIVVVCQTVAIAVGWWFLGADALGLALSLPFVFLMALLVLADVKAPLEELFAAVTRTMQGYDEAPTRLLGRSDEFGFAGQLLVAVQAYLRRHRAVVDAVLQVTVGRLSTGSGTAIEEHLRKVALDHFEIEALDFVVKAPAAAEIPLGIQVQIRQLGEWAMPSIAAVLPIPLAEQDLVQKLRDHGWSRTPSDEEIARSQVIVFDDLAGNALGMAVFTMKAGAAALEQAGVRHLTALCGAYALHVERSRVTAAVEGQLERRREERVESGVRGAASAELPIERGALVADGRAVRERDTDLLACLDLGERGTFLLVGDALVAGQWSVVARAAVIAAVEALRTTDGPVRAANVLRTANAALFRLGEGTLPSALAVLRLDGERVEYANAGVSRPILRAGAGFEPIELAGPLLGVEPDPDYAQRVVHLGPGDTLLLYTDGMEEDGPGRELLSTVLANARGKTASWLAEQLGAAVVGARAGRLDPDDATFVVVQRKA